MTHYSRARRAGRLTTQVLFQHPRRLQAGRFAITPSSGNAAERETGAAPPRGSVRPGEPRRIPGRRLGVGTDQDRSGAAGDDGPLRSGLRPSTDLHGRPQVARAVDLPAYYGYSVGCWERDTSWST